ncbi:MAG: methionine--tRNA ligase [Wenzhouxiangellaceae bacterium]
MRRRILVTAALPYANGPIHIGHMLEFVQTDIWARFQRARGHQVVFAWADDAHGTPIMLNAEQRGITPEALIEHYGREHRRDFDDFAISYDNFSSTHTETNRQLVEQIWARLNERGCVVEREIEQFYDPEKAMFLPDRYIRGRCPRCGAEDQYGDSCEVCSATYEPGELVEPRSVISGARPVLKTTRHCFVRLAPFADVLKSWIGSGAVQPEVANKLAEWFESGLKDWDVTRDAPYFGFPIPGRPKQYFYVWMDAPVGYLASFREYCEREGLDFDAWLEPGTDTELHHFIGKDIIYFHCLFWPAMLDGAGLRLPTQVHAHGFLTVNGTKMSKSRGTFITARTWLDHLPADTLRYYLAAKLGPGLADIDLNLDDFVARINSDLVGKLVNIASRSAGFVHKFNDGLLDHTLPDPALYADFVAELDRIASDYEQCNYASAIRRVMALADRANRYIDDHKPWQMAKQSGQADKVVAVCTQALNLFRVLMGALAPVLPRTAAQAAAFLNAPLDDWAALSQPLLDHRIEGFSPLARRIEPRQIEALLAASRESLAAQSTATPNPSGNAEQHDKDHADMISIDDFTKVDLRIARIVEAGYVEGADRLLRLVLDLGDEQRQVFAGIRSAYDPADLKGRLTVMVANLAPRKMRFGVSEGMVLAAGGEDGGPFLLSPDDGARPGMRVK